MLYYKIGDTMIDYAQKPVRKKPLHGMFTALPPRYDLINHIITWGLDRHWRRQAVRECLTPPPRKVLDLCCGTGDLAISLARLARNDVELTGLDYSSPMLEIAAGKAERLTSGKDISFVCGDAAYLPFPDGHLDCIGISFAFRNLTYHNRLAPRYLTEVWRVLGEGGRFVIVETSQPRSRLIRELFHRYLRWFVSPVGHLLSGNRGAYHYLSESAVRFYTPEEIKEMLIAAGFRRVSCRPLFLGAISIHVATK